MKMRVLALMQGKYGRRIVENLRRQSPPEWSIAAWEAPPVLPPVIDYPEEYLPERMAPTDLLLSLGEHPGVVELLPDVARRTSARSVIAPVDNLAWLPSGLMNQVERWLADLGITVVFPKPFCSLTETTYSLRHRMVEYSDPWIAEFARHFGRPAIRLEFAPDQPTIKVAQVQRDSPCGCASHVAEHLIGLPADEAEHAAGMAHHHFPCLAGMAIDPDYGDTLMHVSGHIMKAEIAAQAKPFKRPPGYLTPAGRVD